MKQTEENTILQEITPLGEHDFMYVADRHKTCFDFPMHKHDLFELNFIENARGCRRIVGDSDELTDDIDLVLITSPQLEHQWAQGDCTSTDIHEITVQFQLDYTHGIFLTNAFKSIAEMLIRAQSGLAFPKSAIMQVYPRLQRISSIRRGFYAVDELFNLLYELSQCTESRTLASSSFAKADTAHESRRVNKVKKYIDEHYMDDLRLEQLSEMVAMTPAAFSRFFHQRTGKSLAEYIIDIRLGHAARMLIDSIKPVSEICYTCGFNTLSNFNRLFRKRKGCSPSEFREKYVKTKVIV
ncbi:MAG: helix-turn-helix domain-containing protein [Paludibacteraceae bacterium]|nr:helix-turn-helix domain-containing protein [Paludibacteraceae bacterium]